MGLGRNLLKAAIAFLGGLLLGICPLAGQAAAVGASDWVNSDQGALRLISATKAVGDAGQLQLGLEFHLKPGWKIYWRSPGDAGLPPAVDWKGSDNLADAMISWPAPHRFSVSGLETMGYKDEVVLPIMVRLNDPAQPVSLKASVDYLVCEVLCVPGHADLALDLPAGPAEAAPSAHLISRFLAQVPGNGAAQGLSLVSVQATDSGALKVVVGANPPMAAPDLFIERADQMQFSKPAIRLAQGGRRVVFEVTPTPKTGEGGLLDKPLTLTVVDGSRGMEAVADVAPPEPGSRVGKILIMMGVALLGGFILNLMPCVLPVLSLKVLGLVQHAGAERRVVRSAFLASAAGILASFIGLAGTTALLRAAGTAVGWGLQFQHPLFLAAMVVVVTLFAANLFGLFEIPLPRWAADMAAEAGEPRHLAGHFGAGVFATLLATPCSAPFLGTAVGFALARGAPEIFAIFIALGLGMASPFLAIALWPDIARWLPRPGRWMVALRRLLGLALLATAGWLIVVLSAETGVRTGVAVGVLMVLAVVALALGRHGATPVRATSVRTAVVAAAALGTVILAGGLVPGWRTSAQTPDAFKGVWKPFDKRVLADEVGAGKVVFVDVTAEWCITCQVNKVTVVYRGKVAQTLNGPDVIAMEADWTRPDETISAYLASFGRYGVPFNAVYGPGAPDGIVLPELLTEKAVLDALGKAKKPL